MALIKRADADRVARDAMVMDLRDLVAYGEAMESSARRNAEQIVRDARAERERLVRDANQVGHDEGYARGFDEGRRTGLEEGRRQGVETVRDECGPMARAMEVVLNELDAARGEMLIQARRDVLELALTIARRVTKRVVEIDPGVVEGQLEAALEHVLGASALVVTVHPEDEEVAQNVLPALRARFDESVGVSLRTDEAVGRGSCVVRSGAGEIDATIESQLARIADAVGPSERGHDAPPGHAP